MGNMTGEASVHVDAAPERCYEIAADVDHISEWQGGVQRVEVLERDAEGRAVLIEMHTDAKVRTIKSRIAFEYDPPAGLSWKQVKGDLKSVVGSWSFEADGDGTLATYRLDGDPGRVIGMLIRGPVEGKLRDLLVSARPGELKIRAEAG